MGIIAIAALVVVAIVLYYIFGRSDNDEPGNK
jgi:hypothetical protein